MRTSGFGLSALLIAAGAILAWAVTYEAEGVDLSQVGVILFFVGVGLGVITLVSSLAGRRTIVDSEQQSVINGQPTVQRRHDVIVEQDA